MSWMMLARCTGSCVWRAGWCNCRATVIDGSDPPSSRVPADRRRLSTGTLRIRVPVLQGASGSCCNIRSPLAKWVPAGETSPARRPDCQRGHPGEPDRRRRSGVSEQIGETLNGCQRRPPGFVGLPGVVPVVGHRQQDPVDDRPRQRPAGRRQLGVQLPQVPSQPILLCSPVQQRRIFFGQQQRHSDPPFISLDGIEAVPGLLDGAQRLDEALAGPAATDVDPAVARMPPLDRCRTCRCPSGDPSPAPWVGISV